MSRFAKIDGMPTWLAVTVVGACLFCVLAICIAPDLDLPDTIHRGLESALMILLGLAGFGWMITARFEPHGMMRPGRSLAEALRAERTRERITEPGSSCVQRC